MNFLNFNLKKILIIAALFALPLISINTQKSPVDSQWYNQPFFFVSSLMQQGLFSFSAGVRDTTSKYLDLIKIKNEIELLKKQNDVLMAKMTVYQELEIENSRLAKLLDFREKSKMNLVAAKIMSKDIISEHHTIQIDKGSNDGLQNGMAVITTSGVVGYIFRPQLKTSHVLLITDRYSVIDGVNSRSRARGLVEGKSSGSCLFRHVDKSEDVKPGDLVVTSGLDNIFPKGFPVAKVLFVENKPYAVSLKVELEPVVDPNKIEEVFVITNAKDQDLSNMLSLNQSNDDQSSQHQL